MAKEIRCDCGYVVRADTDQELVADAQRHALDVHGIRITAEQVLGMAQPV